MILNVITDISTWNKWMFKQDVLCSLFSFFSSMFNISNIFIDFFTSNHWNTNHKVTEKTILSSSLKCFLTLWLGLHHLHALVDGTQNDGFEGSYFEAFVVVNLIKNVEGDNTLHFCKHVPFK